MMDNNRNMRYQYVLARTGLSDANDRIPPLQQYFYFLGKVLQLLSVLGSLMYVLISRHFCFVTVLLFEGASLCATRKFGNTGYHWHVPNWDTQTVPVHLIR
ncbi:hypothetical protein VTP01DRAFT_10278 [Rhizomucor pusillus]|uniref:uncharacterized protein n=1 Tax=Rhizomucor pusillus TaxID=4840 RepID=UPI003743E4A9